MGKERRERKREPLLGKGRECEWNHYRCKGEKKKRILEEKVGRREERKEGGVTYLTTLPVLLVFVKETFQTPQSIFFPSLSRSLSLGRRCFSVFHKFHHISKSE